MRCCRSDTAGMRIQTEHRYQEPFLDVPSLLRNRYGQHGGPGSVGARASRYARAQNWYRSRIIVHPSQAPQEA